MGKTQNTGNLTNAIAQDSSNNIGIGGAASGSYKLQVTGTTNLTGALTGTSGTFSSGLIVSNTSDVYPEFKTSAADADAFLGFSNTGDGNNAWGVGRRNTGEFWITNFTGNFNSGTRTTVLSLASTGAATFSSSVTALSGIYKPIDNATEAIRIYRGNSSAYLNESAIFDASGGMTNIRNNSLDSVRSIIFSFSTDGSNTYTERVRITSGGNVGIGTSSPSSLKLTVEGNGNNIRIRNSINTRYRSDWYVNSNGDSGINAYDDTGSVYKPIYIDGSTIALNGNGATGNVLIGTATDAGTGKLQVNGRVVGNGFKSATQVFGFFKNSTGSFEWEVGSDSYVGTGMYMYNSDYGYVFRLTSAGVLTTSGGGTSDRRTKEDIKSIDNNALTFINELNPVSFKFITDKNKQTRRGFIAQEVLETSIPDLVLGDGDQEGGTYGLDYDGILALAVKAIQEQQAQIEELKELIKSK